MSQQLGNYYDRSKDIKELRRINIKSSKMISELKKKIFNIRCDEGMYLEIIHVNKTRTHASGTVSIIKNYK